MSGAYAGTIPAEILPLEPEVERALVGTLLQELNEKFCVNLDPNPSLDRSGAASRPRLPCTTPDGQYTLGGPT
jgi:hypothetical protein